MNHQLINKIFFPERNRVYSVLQDIDAIYDCINQNGEINDERSFQQSFSGKYWEHLKYYSWLSSEQQDYLITGCLNIILFMAHKYLESDGKLLQKYYDEINTAVDSFIPQAEVHEKLHYIVKEALILSWKKMNDFTFNSKKDNIYQSISWTLKYTIMKSNNPLQK